ncbi:MAG TPA: ribosome maturation factor RimM [Longimicrobium sp.]|jgi:16S rRNA processing protein RimM
MDDAQPGFLIVGAVQKPHGIKGELFVRLETDRPDAVFRPGRVLRLGDAQGRPAGGELTVERARAFKGGLLLKAAEHGQRTAEVDALRGKTLLIPAAEAVAPDEDEVFYHQLVGLRVTAAGEAVGTVRDVYEMPSGVLLGIERAGKKELLVPFVRDLVGRVDVAAGVLELEAVPGLLDL